MADTVSTALRFRWLNGQSFEFRFTNGKTLITDPWFVDDGSFMAKKCVPGFSLDEITACDYVFLNHTHGDHIADLGRLVEKFQPTVIAHSAVCMALQKEYHITPTSVYPVDYEGTYYFDGFILETHHGTHHAQKGGFRGAPGGGAPIKMPGNEELGTMGGIFNMNFVLTTQEGFRVAFIGGNDDGMIARLQGTGKPNIVIRNKMASSAVKTNVAEDFAAWFAAVDVPLLVPMHYETWLTEDPEFAQAMIRDMNEIMKAQNKIGRVAGMTRGKWHTLDLMIREE